LTATHRAEKTNAKALRRIRRAFYARQEKRMEYMSISQAAEKWGITPRRIQVLCAQERIPGATRIGFVWAIPKNAEKPKDARIKSGKYVKRDQSSGTVL